MCTYKKKHNSSAAIQLSDIPFEYPISEVRVARVDGMFVINPSRDQLDSSDIDIMIGASVDSVAMVEGFHGDAQVTLDAARDAGLELPRTVPTRVELPYIVPEDGTASPAPEARSE